MGKLIDWFVSVPTWVWDKLDGWKTYLAGSALVLTGLGGLAGEIVPVLSSHSLGAIYSFAMGLPHDASWLLAVKGLLVFGVGHKLEKLAPDTSVPLPNQTPS